MSKITTLAAALLLATSAFALPAAAQSHGDRDHDRHGWSRNDDRNDHHRDDRRLDDDRRYGNDDRRDDRYDRRDRDYRYAPRYVAPRVYRPAYAYGAPRGYAVQRWHVGGRMPAPYYVSRYYVDPYAYQLRIPPRGHHWVRVDRDVYLVSIASGIVTDVLYGIFR